MDDRFINIIQPDTVALSSELKQALVNVLPFCVRQRQKACRVDNFYIQRCGRQPEKPLKGVRLR